MDTTSDALYDKSDNLIDVSAVKNNRNIQPPAPVDIIPSIPKDKILVEEQEISWMTAEKEREYEAKFQQWKVMLYENFPY